MPACDDKILLVSSLVDGELDAANSALVEAHLTHCEACREEFERQQAIRTMLSGSGARYEAPDSLKNRIRSKPEFSGRARQANRLPGWLAPGVAAALAASLAVVVLTGPTAQSAMDQQLISSHVRSLQPGHLTDVQTTNQHIVKPWFNGKVDFAPPVPELADAGFPLAGGRLDSIDGKTVAAIVYHRRLHTINLFVWRGDQSFGRAAVEDGFSLREWDEGGLQFAAVSDIPPDELKQFEMSYRGRASGTPTRAGK
jgi:mycothiol system anti-sigma-R factor